MESHPTPSSHKDNTHLYEQELLAKHLELRSYKECIGRAYGWGLASFALAFSSSYFILKALTHRAPLEGKYYFAIPSLLGSLSAFYFTKQRAQLCHERFPLSQKKGELNKNEE